MSGYIRTSLSAYCLLYVIVLIGPTNIIKGLYLKKLVWQMAKERVFFTRWHTVTSCIELVQRVYRLLKGFLLGFLFYSASFLKSKFGRGSIEVFFFTLIYMFWLVHLVDVIRNKLSEITLGEHDHRYHSLLTTSCFLFSPRLD